MSTVFRVQKNANYTTMSNYHLKDRELSLKAKGLMSVILSLPEDWDYSLKGLSYITNDGLASVRSGIQELEKRGYITRGEQTRDENGRMSASEYFVYENPEQNPYFNAKESEESDASINGITKPNPTACENRTRSSETVSTACDFPTTENPTTENRTRDTLLNNQVLNNQVLINQSSSARAGAREEDGQSDGQMTVSVDKSTRNELRKTVRENIGYNEYVGTSTEELVYFITELILDVVLWQKTTSRINGCEVPQRFVRERFLQLRKPHIDCVIDTLNKNKSSIRNVRGFLVSALYNAPLAVDGGNRKNQYKSSFDVDACMATILERYKRKGD